MKNQVGQILASILLGVLTLGSTVQAQHTERTIKANIPFDFVVGSEVFPAGHYSLVFIGPVLLELHDSEGRVLANVLTHAVQASTRPVRPKLLFESEAGQQVLTQVWQQGEFTGLQILQPKSGTLAVQKRSRHVQTAQVGNPR
jgi:hypothetical protein